MGGYGCGGKNKAHRTIDNYRRIDSFQLMRNIKDNLEDGDDLPIIFEGGAILFDPFMWHAEIKMGEKYIPLKVYRVEGIDGTRSRMYFCCPLCKRRVRFLYNYRGYYTCRHCLNANYTSQQCNRGTDAIKRKARKIIVDELGLYNWQQYTINGIMDVHIPEKPLYMRWKKFNRLIAEYQQLQDDFIAELLKMCKGLIDPEGITECLTL